MEDVGSLVFLPPIGLSDHVTVSFVWSKYPPQMKTEIAKRSVWKTDFEGLLSEAETMAWDILVEFNVQQAWNLHKSKTLKLYERYAPIIKNRKVCTGPLGSISN